jgi:hypothetical protein
MAILEEALAAAPDDVLTTFQNILDEQTKEANAQD